MSTTWDEARTHALAELEAAVGAEFEAPAGTLPLPPPPPRAAVTLIVVDRFDLSMVEPHPRGVRLLVRPLSRLEALSLVRAHRDGVAVVAINERGQGMIERELQIEPAWRPTVCHGTRMLVIHQVRWNDIRWHLVEYESDGDGCIP